jgi:hypothetical protein
MFSLFKLAIDALMAGFFFYAGVKAEQSYPNFLGKLLGLGSTLWAWLKSVL